jgi:thioredoxin reductase
MPKDVDVVIIGGSYAGLSAAMTLGRSMRKVLVIDAGKPCNRQTPHAHNLITHDGDRPADIAQKAKEQVLQYPTVRFIKGKAVSASGTDGNFQLSTEAGQTYTTRKIILATGVRDIPLPIDGFAECWGISVLHCPYCHGYEVRNQTLGVIGNGEMGFEFARLIHQWSPTLTLFTNGPSTLSAEQIETLGRHRIDVQSGEIMSVHHDDGYIKQLVFKDGSTRELDAVFARGGIEQHSDLAVSLGVELHEEGKAIGLIKADDFGKTNVAGVYAAGDNSTPMRALAVAMGAGMKAGAFVNHELIADSF